MAISESIDFTVTRTDIITEALEQLGVLEEGETPTVDQIGSSSRTLNMLVKTWQADGLNLFAIKRQYLFINPGQESYNLDVNTTDHFTDTFVQTTTTDDALESDFIIEVESVTGMTVGDFIGISSTTSIQWTTIASINTTTLEIALADSLENDVSSGSIVFTYTTKANRPMKIMEAFIHLSKGATDIPVGHISRRRYNELSVKTATGLVNQYYYDPQLSPNANLFVWPTGDSADNYLVLFSQKTLSDLDTGSNNPEYPQEWYLPLALTLAVDLAPKYGIPNTEYYKLRDRAEMYYERAKGFDDELYTRVLFRPDMRGEDI